MGAKKDNYFTSIPLKKRDSYLAQLSEKYNALKQSLEGKLDNSPNNSESFCYDGAHSCPINELYTIDKEDLKESILRLEGEIKIIKETLL